MKLENVINPFKIAALRKRLLFTIGLIAVYRIGVFIPTPGVDAAGISAYMRGLEGTIFGLLNLFSGGAFEQFSIFALGIMPYITASIIMSLLTKAVPYLEQLQKEGGEWGRRKINQFTRYGTLLIALIHGSGISYQLHSAYNRGEPLIVITGFWFYFYAIVTLVTGAVFVMWLGEQISERGIGNGSSILIFANIIARLPHMGLETFKSCTGGELPFYMLFVIILIIVGITAGVIFMLQGHRKIPVEYPKRIVGKRIYGGQSSYLPLQINSAGVIPPIFSSAILSLPATAVQWINLSAVPFLGSLAAQLSYGGSLYSILDALLILFFTYFYTGIVFNPDDVAENLRKSGGFVPGIRPGKSTSEYIDKILWKITFVGALFLVTISFVPRILTNNLGLIPFTFGGTSILIAVGVALDTVRQIEAHMLYSHYEGFLKKGKIKGRFIGLR
jgi:preprotein translocase subunit SecY